MDDFRNTRQVIGITCQTDQMMRRVVSSMRDLKFYGLIIEKHPTDEGWYLVSGFAPESLHGREYWRELITELCGFEV